MNTNYAKHEDPLPLMLSLWQLVYDKFGDEVETSSFFQNAFHRMSIQTDISCMIQKFCQQYTIFWVAMCVYFKIES